MRGLLSALLALFVGTSGCLSSCDGVLGGGVDSVLADPVDSVLSAPPVDGDDAPVDLVPGYASFYARASGASNLSTTVTINSVAVVADFAYDGTDAAASWAGVVGDTLTVGGTGTAPTTGVRAPAIDGTRAVASGAATGVNAQTYRSTTAYGNTTTKDVMWEIVMKRCNPGAAGYLATTSTSGISTAGLSIYQDSATTRLRTYEGTTLRADVSDAAAIPTHGEWVVYHGFYDHANATGSQWFKNGTSLAAAANATTWAGFAGSTLTIGGTPDSNVEGMGTDCGVAYISQFSAAAWFAGGATNSTHWTAVAKQRTADWAGLHVEDANGVEYEPITITRANSEACAIYDETADSVRLFNLAAHMPCVQNTTTTTAWGSSAGTRVDGLYATHNGVTNLVADIASDLSLWTNVGSTDTANQSAGAFGTTTLDSIVGDGIEGEHGVSTSETLTAARYTYSHYVRAGAQGFAYLDVSTIANVSAYFNLSTCKEATVGSASTAETENAKGGLCRITISYTGTVAAHTHRVLCAEADGDKSSAVATACLDVGEAQIELSDVVTPFHEPTTARAGLDLRYPDDGVWPGSTTTGTAHFTYSGPNRSGTGSTATSLATVSNGASANSWQPQIAATGHNNQNMVVASVVTITGTATAPTDPANDTWGRINYVAQSWSLNHAGSWDGGWSTAIDTSVAATLDNSTATAFVVGARESGAAQLRGLVHRIDFFTEQKSAIVSIYGDSQVRATPYVSSGQQGFSVAGELVKSDFRAFEGRGVGNDTCDLVAARLACTGPYEAVIVWCGLVDLLSDPWTEVQTDLEGITATVNACGVDIIHVTVIPYVGLTAPQMIERNTLNEWIRARAGTAGVRAVIDVDELVADPLDHDVLDPAYDFGDGHLNAAGQAIMGAQYVSAVGW